MLTPEHAQGAVVIQEDPLRVPWVGRDSTPGEALREAPFRWTAHCLCFSSALQLQQAIFKASDLNSAQ